MFIADSLSMKMDFLYGPTDCKSSNESQQMTQRCSYYVEKTALGLYYDSRNELIEDGGLVYRGERRVVPQSLRADMLKKIHRSHIGIGGSLSRARELLYWPRINAKVKDYVSKCSVCQ